MVAPIAGGPLVEFEWMGLRNYLGEREGARRRGRYATSGDLLIAFEAADGARHGVLVESKYTEAYEPERWLRRSPSGTDRVAIYRPSFERPDSPFVPDAPTAALFMEPFDQHLRQQLLAAAMEREGELGFQTVTCLHVAPMANVDFHRGVTSPALRSRGETVAETWRSLLRRPERYRTMAYEDAFRIAESFPALRDWADYQQGRYGWPGAM